MRLLVARATFVASSRICALIDAKTHSRGGITLDMSLRSLPTHGRQTTDADPDQRAHEAALDQYLFASAIAAGSALSTVSSSLAVLTVLRGAAGSSAALLYGGGIGAAGVALGGIVVTTVAWSRWAQARGEFDRHERAAGIDAL